MKLKVPDDKYPEKYWLKYNHEVNPRHVEFLLGKKIDTKDKTILFSLKNKVSVAAISKYDFLYSDGADVVSEKIVRVLNEICPNDIQLLPAIVNVSGVILSNYYALNVLKSEHALDLEKCVYFPLGEDDDAPKRFEKIALLDREPSSDIFRALEKRSSIILSDRLAQALEETSVKGIRFVSKI
ncbi:imm11 family protein [Pseudomonas alabamensis]|uniref:imm11 family protein n=1 Tax=Pseudomonas alabamensis TaxID=3064349 RepID=UPI000A54D3EE